MKRSKMKVILLSLAAAVLLSCAAVGIYAADYYRIDQAAASALMSTETVTVEIRDGHAIFFPKEPTQVGFVFYPGGKVEYTAYAPLMQALAQQGILCVIPHMPLNLAVMDPHEAENVTAQFPEIETWYMGGHSLGGSMAATHAAVCHKVTGLVLLAAYSTEDLTHSNLKVLSIYGSADGVLNPEKYREYFPNLPESTIEIVIEGGNHAQFGSYGAQEGDGNAAITSDDQLRQTVTAILDFMAINQ